MPTRKRHIGYPDAKIFDRSTGKQKVVDHLLWGSYVRDLGERKGKYRVKDVHGHVQEGKFAKVKIRGRKEPAWMHEHAMQDERVLEVIFVDIGQGDGTLVVTPKDKQIVIDAGETDNMYRFLRWRFGRFSKPFAFESAIITHPDADHYEGFDRFFDDPNVTFDTVYHNGIVERFDKSGLGPRKKVGRTTYLVDLVEDEKQLGAFLKKKANWQRKTKKGGISKKQYPTMLEKGLSGESFRKFRSLSVADGFVPGYGPDQELSLEILGPVVEEPGLRWLSDKGKTKNGHSVVLRLKYRKVSMLLGGDLNIPAEKLLLEHHTEMEMPRESEDHEAFVEAAQQVFGVDIAKACHHGSPDFSIVFLEALNSVATVISSGDDEPHAHPRAETLGSIGAYSRGARPLIFSTELARSAKETIKHPNLQRAKMKAKLRALAEAPDDERAKLREKLDEELGDMFDRSVAVYGAINVITDGQQVLIAQKLERKRGSTEWDIYRLEREGNGPLRFESKH